ncbi:MAG: hypothetical protein AB1805_08860 [Nitrospirota bacterium]
MKRVFELIVWFSAMLLIAEGYGNTLQRMPIAPNGQTIIEGRLHKHNVKVTIETHIVQIGKPSDKRPVRVNSSCTYSRYPCSLVDSIDITVSGSPIRIPRSVFCDLADLNSATINEEKKRLLLTLTGGDASESYIMKIEFDTQRVRKRSLFSGESNRLLQETTYYQVVIDGD